MNTNVTLAPDPDLTLNSDQAQGQGQDQGQEQNQVQQENSRNKHPIIAAPDTSQLIDCEACHASIPLSAARVSEGEDYIIYFCGLQCYEKWFKLKHKASR